MPPIRDERPTSAPPKQNPVVIVEEQSIFSKVPLQSY